MWINTQRRYDVNTLRSKLKVFFFFIERVHRLWNFFRRLERFLDSFRNYVQICIFFIFFIFLRNTIFIFLKHCSRGADNSRRFSERNCFRTFVRESPLEWMKRVIFVTERGKVINPTVSHRSRALSVSMNSVSVLVAQDFSIRRTYNTGNFKVSLNRSKRDPLKVFRNYFHPHPVFLREEMFWYGSLRRYLRTLIRS